MSMPLDKGRLTQAQYREAMEDFSLLQAAQEFTLHPDRLAELAFKFPDTYEKLRDMLLDLEAAGLNESHPIGDDWPTRESANR